MPKDAKHKLAAIEDEFEMDDLEEEMAGKTAEERAKIIEREGSTREQTLAVRARARAKLAERFKELEKKKAAPKEEEAPAETPEVKPASTHKPPPEKSNVIDLSERRRRVVRWAANSLGSIAVAAVIFGIYLGGTNQHITAITPVATGTATGAGTGTAAGTGTGAGPGTWDDNNPYNMRYEGMSYCAIHDYVRCLDLLDKANAKDPTGEADFPRVQVARHYAEQALAGQKHAP